MVVFWGNWCKKWRLKASGGGKSYGLLLQETVKIYKVLRVINCHDHFKENQLLRVCTSFLLLCNKLPQILQLKTKLFSHSFSRWGVWEQLSWLILAQGSLLSLIWRLGWGSSRSQAHPCVSWKVSIPQWLMSGDFSSLPHGPLHRLP